MDRNSPKFKDLKSKWYEKLRREGFDDIEHDESALKSWASSPFNRKKKGHTYKDREVEFQSQAEHYRLAGQFYWDYQFKNETEKRIWEFHKDGISIRNIVIIIKKKYRTKTHRDFVHITIQRLTRLMLGRLLRNG